MKMRRESRSEFEEFVTQVLARLINFESTKMASPSTLEVFCRMDVGLIFGETGRAFYFVNEIERTNTASLWTTLRSKPEQTIANDFQLALSRWVKGSRRI